MRDFNYLVQDRQNDLYREAQHISQGKLAQSKARRPQRRSMPFVLALIQAVLKLFALLR